MRLKKSLGIQCQTVYQHAWRTDLLLFQICEENLNNIDSVENNTVKNFGIKQNAEDLLKCLKPLSVAVDKIQEKNCTIAVAVHIWEELEKTLCKKTD